MKLKDISAILRARSMIRIFNGENCQWFSDGSACYPIYGLPEMDDKSLRVLLDISEDKWQKYNVLIADLPFSEQDNYSGEFELHNIGMVLNYKGIEVIPLVGNYKMFFVQSKYLKPIFRDVNDYHYYARQMQSGEYMIAVKLGFILGAVIMPFDIVNDEFVECLKMMHERSIYLLNEKKQREADDLNMQNFLIDDLNSFKEE